MLDVYLDEKNRFLHVVDDERQDNGFDSLRNMKDLLPSDEYGIFDGSSGIKGVIDELYTEHIPEDVRTEAARKYFDIEFPSGKSYRLDEAGRAHINDRFGDDTVFTPEGATGDYEHDKPLLRDIYAEIPYWYTINATYKMVESECLDPTPWIIVEEGRSNYDQNYEFAVCREMKPEDAENKDYIRTELESLANDMRAAADGDIYDDRIFRIDEMAKTGLDIDAPDDMETWYTDTWTIGNSLKEQGMVYLGEYRDLDECLEKNAKLLGIDIGTMEVPCALREIRFIPDEAEFQPSREDVVLGDGGYYLTTSGFIAEVHNDPYADDPREDEGNVGIFVGPSKFKETLIRYNVEQTESLRNDVLALEKAVQERGGALLPVSSYSHGGTEYYEGFPEGHFDGSWDCSFEGVMIAEPEKISEFGITREQAEENLRGELDIYNRWANGEVYEAVIYARDGEEDDRIAGIYSSEELGEWCGGEIAAFLGQYRSIDDCIMENLETLRVEAVEEEKEAVRTEPVYHRTGRGR